MKKSHGLYEGSMNETVHHTVEVSRVYRFLAEMVSE